MKDFTNPKYFLELWLRIIYDVYSDCNDCVLWIISYMDTALNNDVFKYVYFSLRELYQTMLDPFLRMSYADHIINDAMKGANNKKQAH